MELIMSSIRELFASNWDRLGYEQYSPRKGMTLLNQVSYIEKNQRGSEEGSTFNSIVVLGSQILENSEGVLKNFGVYTTPGSKVGRKLSDFAEREAHGSILAATPWTMPMNDAFIFAAIRAGKEFHLTHKDLESLENYQIWKAKDERISMMAREIVIILENGYTPIVSESGFFGMVFKRESNDENGFSEDSFFATYRTLQTLTTLAKTRAYFAAKKDLIEYVV